MWTFLKGLLVQWAILKLLLKSLGSLGILVPLAFLLKLLGLKVLGVLGVLALPVLIILAVIGLPFILVFLMGGVLLALVAGALFIGIMALKIILPIALVLWLISLLFGWRKKGGDTPGEGKTADGATSV